MFVKCHHKLCNYFWSQITFWKCLAVFMILFIIIITHLFYYISEDNLAKWILKNNLIIGIGFHDKPQKLKKKILLPLECELYTLIQLPSTWKQKSWNNFGLMIVGNNDAEVKRKGDCMPTFWLIKGRILPSVYDMDLLKYASFYSK